MSLKLPLLLLLWLRLAVRLNFLCIADATIAAFLVPGDFEIKENMVDFKHSMDMHVHVTVACICATLKEATIRCHHKSNPNTEESWKRVSLQSIHNCLHAHVCSTQNHPLVHSWSKIKHIIKTLEYPFRHNHCTFSIESHQPRSVEFDLV